MRLLLDCKSVQTSGHYKESHPPLQEFYTDFAHVADDESRHLGWCLQRLGELGFSYGDMPAHNKLWEGAQSSAGERGCPPPLFWAGSLQPPQ